MLPSRHLHGHSLAFFLHVHVFEGYITTLRRCSRLVYEFLFNAHPPCISIGVSSIAYYYRRFLYLLIVLGGTSGRVQIATPCPPFGISSLVSIETIVRKRFSGGSEQYTFGRHSFHLLATTFPNTHIVVRCHAWQFPVGSEAVITINMILLRASTLLNDRVVVLCVYAHRPIST